MVKYPKANDFQGAVFLGYWNESDIPIYDVPSMHSLNQLVGYVKHINAGNGTVLYRGQCKLYEHVVPSIMHDLATIKNNKRRMNSAINGILYDAPFRKFFGLKNETIVGWQLFQRLIVEATLQHYGAKTFCVDFVDNHWTALWFGLYEWDGLEARYKIRENTNLGEPNLFIKKSDNMNKKSLPVEPIITDITLDDNKMKELKIASKNAPISYNEIVQRHIDTKYKYALRRWRNECQRIEQYNHGIDMIENTDHLFLFLYVSETNSSNLHGVYFGEKTYTIDLRKALPSTFLRPCAQHGWIVRGKQDDYVFDDNVSCVIRINVDLAKIMLGNGLLLSQDNFFPDETIDQGYHVLLERQKKSRLESKYEKVLPKETITDFGKHTLP